MGVEVVGTGWEAFSEEGTCELREMKHRCRSSETGPAGRGQDQKGGSRGGVGEVREGGF